MPGPWCYEAAESGEEIASQQKMVLICVVMMGGERRQSEERQAWQIIQNIRNSVAETLHEPRSRTQLNFERTQPHATAGCPIASLQVLLTVALTYNKANQF